MQGMTMDEAMTHMKDHITYPASKADTMEACNMMSDVPEKDKQWLGDNLPDKTYNSDMEVKDALMPEES